MHPLYRDRRLQCRTCRQEFWWTAGEQAFFAGKGLLHAPGRCAACRAQSRAPGTSPNRRDLYAALCDRCGGQAQVPFQPSLDKPVYCSTCFDIVRSSPPRP